MLLQHYFTFKSPENIMKYTNEKNAFRNKPISFISMHGKKCPIFVCVLYRVFCRKPNNARTEKYLYSLGL